MEKKNLHVNIIFFIILLIFSTSINFYYGNIGVFPIDTFAFFDTAYSILLNKHPFKDVWITTGPLVDYIQAFFFKLFGANWFSYLLHSSLFNFLITITIFFTLKELGLGSNYSFLYSLSVATLCYPIAGTPFAYQHAFIFSIISLMLLFLSIKTKSNFFWFLLPIVMTLAFLSMHVPSSYVNLVIIFFILIYFFFNLNFLRIVSFLFGALFILSIIIFFFLYFEIPIIKFVQQYILFPLSVGEYRILNPDYDFSLGANFTFRRIIGHFKFIHIFLLFIIVSITFSLIKKKIIFSKDDLIIYASMVFSTIFLIFHQLITANQTFIFSIIPILAGISHIIMVKHISKKKIYHLIILFLVVVATIKYHVEYNEKRKFMDLQNTDLSKAVNANLIDKKFRNLKWINPFFPGSPEEEINLLKEIIQKIKNDNRKKMVITHYQFFSIILEEDLNIPNRWYLANASHPIKDHKYHKYYQDHFKKKIQQNNISVIYVVGPIQIKDFEIYIDEFCFEKKEINSISSVIELKECE